MWVGSLLAVAVVEAGNCSSDSTLSLGISISCGCSPEKPKKKKKKDKQKAILLTEGNLGGKNGKLQRFGENI